MMYEKVLFQVRYIGENSHIFTKGQVYNVFNVDEDGDYLVLNDFKDLILEYKSRFEYSSR